MRNAFIAWCLLVAAVPVSAAQEPPETVQESRAALIAQQQAEKALTLTPQLPPKAQRVIDRAEDLFAKGAYGITPTFGGTRAGSGFAPGLAYTRRMGDSQLKTRAIWSYKDTRRVESAFTLPVAGRTTIIQAFWEDAPEARWFGYGMSGTEITDGLEQRGVSVGVELPLAAWFDVAGGLGYLHGQTDSLDAASWGQAWLSAALDRRTSPDYTRRGYLYSVRGEYVDAQERANASFERLTVDVRHFVPVMHEHWIVAVQLRTELTNAEDSTPYYLLPSLGGGSSLRGYASYRFIDRQSVFGSAELRWTAARTVDFAVFMDHGAVARRVKDLRADDLASGWGFGARFHGDRTTAVRIDVAHGREGWALHFSRHASF